QLRLVYTSDQVRSYTASNLFSGSRYEFGVASIDIHNNQSAITTVTLSTGTSTDHNVPAAPSSTSLVAVPFSASRSDVQWAHSTTWNVAGYEVWRDGAKVATITLPNSPSYSDNGLAPSSRHTYTVRALSSTRVASAFTSGRSTTTLPSGTV